MTTRAAWATRPTPSTYEFESKTLNYDQDIRLFADIMDIEEAGPSCSARKIAPEADATDILESLREVTGNPVSPWNTKPCGALKFKPAWICSVNPEHIWTATTTSRINAGRGCPYCEKG